MDNPHNMLMLINREKERREFEEKMTWPNNRFIAQEELSSSDDDNGEIGWDHGNEVECPDYNDFIQDLVDNDDDDDDYITPNRTNSVPKLNPRAKRAREEDSNEEIIQPRKYMAIEDNDPEEIDNMEWHSTPPTQPYESDDDVTEIVYKNIPRIVLTKSERTPLKDITVPKDDWEQSIKICKISTDGHVKKENRNKKIQIKKSR